MTSWVNLNFDSHGQLVVELAGRWLAGAGTVRVRRNSMELVWAAGENSAPVARIIAPRRRATAPYIQFLPARLSRLGADDGQIEELIDNLAAFGAVADRSLGSWQVELEPVGNRAGLLLAAVLDFCRQF